MKHSNDLVDKAVQGISTSQPNSVTEAGQTDQPVNNAPEIVDAITQIFALFRVNYHNQYYSAFNDIELLDQAMRLWLESLRHYPVDCLLQAARQIIEQSEYLPTLHKMIEACDQQAGETGLPTARNAYLEACLASHPKAQYTWSHPAVYQAGSKTGWYDLENQPEYISWPKFKVNYEDYKRRALQGEAMPIPQTIALTAPDKSPLSKSERKEELKSLREKLDL